MDIEHIPERDLNQILQRLSFVGATQEDAAWIRVDDNATLLLNFIREQRKIAGMNQFEQTVEEQIEALLAQNQNWHEAGFPTVTESDVQRLIESAPPWPEGGDAFRSLRIRFGHGREGVIQTFEAHLCAIRHVFTPQHFSRGVFFHSGTRKTFRREEIDSLRMLAGNDTHKPVVEWVIIPNLSAHRERDCIDDVRTKNSLADEGLVLAWLIPDRVKAINFKKWPGWFCAGYEENCPVYPWEQVPCVQYNKRGKNVLLRVKRTRHAGPGTAVPFFG